MDSRLWWFLAVASLMGLATTLWLVLPLLKGQRTASVRDQGETNIRILQEELSALELDLKEGRLSPDEVAVNRRDLELRLLEEERAIAADSLPEMIASQSHRKSQKTVAPNDVAVVRWGVALGLPATLAALYLAVGMPTTVDPANTQAGSEAVGIQQIQQMVARLETRLADQPGDAEGWHMLARSYSVLQRLPEAIRAYSSARRLDPNNATLLADFADLLAFQNQSAKGEPMIMIEEALKIDPNHLKALFLGGTAYFEQADYTTAVKHWSKALSLVPPESQEAQGLRGNISEAQAKAGLAPSGGGIPLK